MQNMCNKVPSFKLGPMLAAIVKGVPYFQVKGGKKKMAKKLTT
jgi:hypothetical protein